MVNSKDIDWEGMKKAFSKFIGVAIVVGIVGFLIYQSILFALAELNELLIYLIYHEEINELFQSLWEMVIWFLRLQ